MLCVATGGGLSFDPMFAWYAHYYGRGQAQAQAQAQAHAQAQQAADDAQAAEVRMDRKQFAFLSHSLCTTGRLMAILISTD